MPRLRYDLRSDWMFYLLLAAYAYSITNMTVRLWFGDGVNIFASYSDAVLPAEVILDANKVYWSKTSFLFGTILLIGLNVDIRAAVGAAAAFWAGTLILTFGTSPPLLFMLIVGALLVGQQAMRRQIFAGSRRGSASA